MLVPSGHELSSFAPHVVMPFEMGMTSMRRPSTRIQSTVWPSYVVVPSALQMPGLSIHQRGFVGESVSVGAEEIVGAGVGAGWTKQAIQSSSKSGLSFEPNWHQHEFSPPSVASMCRFAMSQPSKDAIAMHVSGLCVYPITYSPFLRAGAIVANQRAALG